MANAVGIDLGTHTVKLALMEGRLGKLERVTYALRAVPQDEEGAPDLERRLEALRLLLEGLEELPGGTWSAAYPTELASLRTVGLPFTDRGQIDKTIEFEIENYVPFQLSDFVLDYRVLEQLEGRSRVLCAMAERGALAALLEGLAARSVDPRHLLLDAEALASLAGEDGTRLVIDCGHTRTLVALVSGGGLVDARAISFGGRDLTLAICRGLGMSWGEAEGAKHILELGEGEVTIAWDDEATEPQPGGELPAERVVRDALGDLAAGLRATLLAFEERGGAAVESVVLTGGTAGLGGFPAWLSGALGLPVSLAALGEEAERLGDPGRFALARCLVARSAGLTSGRELDFRKEEFTFKGDLATLKQWAGIGIAALGTFCLVAAVMFGLRHHQLSGALEALDEQIAAEVLETFPEVSPSAVSTPMGARAVVVEKSTEAVARVESLGETVGGVPPMLTLLKEISESLPDAESARVEVRELKLSDKSISIKAETTGFEAAAAIETAIKRNERFASAVKGNEKKRGDDLSFTITIPLDDGDDEGEEG